VFPEASHPRSFLSSFSSFPNPLVRILLAAMSIAIFGQTAFANVPKTLHVAEKPHQGDLTSKDTFASGPDEAKSFPASGIAAYKYENRRRTRTSGQIRDVETRLDYFNARYYSPTQGRFTSPDWSETPTPIPYADLSRPQTLNLYAYVGNNPLNRVDPSGHCEGTAYMGLTMEEMREIDRQCLKAGLFSTALILGWGVVEAAPAVLHAAWMWALGNPDKVQRTGEIAVELASPPGPSASIRPNAPTGIGYTSAGAAAVHPALKLPGAANTINHIFGKSAHNLQGLVTQLGSREAAYTALYDATNAVVRAQGTTGLFQSAVNVAGQTVTVRGNVIDGVLRISTAFVP
jgi:RHS repeat-associated protein